ncbi:MAG: hypothetical protein LBP63_02105 [Prevotellaceae bacterium]|nr:hypothetical protein [Prevotellaceae bacterium]
MDVLIISTGDHLAAAAHVEPLCTSVCPFVPCGRLTTGAVVPLLTVMPFVLLTEIMPASAANSVIQANEQLT